MGKKRASFIAFIDGIPEDVFTTEDLGFNKKTGAYIRMVKYQGKEIIIYKFPEGIWQNYVENEKIINYK
jgi:hypothetical protein